MKKNILGKKRSSLRKKKKKAKPVIAETDVELSKE